LKYLKSIDDCINQSTHHEHEIENSFHQR